MGLRVLVKGAGEHATGTAHRLFRCGFQVAMTEIPEPTAVRRWVAFATAVQAGSVQVEGVLAERWSLSSAATLADFHWRHVPVFVDPQATLLVHWQPQVVIDARILKQNLDNHLHQAPLVLGYGPGLRAGRDVHFAVETCRGHDLGRIISSGEAAADTGVPGSIGGSTASRVLRSPGEGAVEVLRDIGSLVEAGELLARVGDSELRAGVSGVVRGMIHPDTRVTRGLKLGDVDPRADPASCSTISDKARCISGAALEIILVSGLAGLS